MYLWVNESQLVRQVERLELLLRQVRHAQIVLAEVSRPLPLAHVARGLRVNVSYHDKPAVADVAVGQLVQLFVQSCHTQGTAAVDRIGCTNKTRLISDYRSSESPWDKSNVRRYKKAL